MSHHSDDHLLIAGSDSFWEPGNYKRTTKRIEDGFKLCTDLQTLIQERAEIEKAYAKNLKTWAKKWGELIEKGPEYGTMEAAWKGILTEADRLSEVHLKVKESLSNDVIQQIKTWQKDNYHKTMMQIKERKEMEEMFKKAQKPWGKYLTKVEKAKADYHTSCKSEKSAANQERNANADSSLSPDQIKKMQERVQRSKDDVQKCREKYEQSLQEINKYNPIYIEEMTGVFNKCQIMEELRLKYFKDILFSIHKCLNISQDPSLPQIYEEFNHTINNSDYQKDLKWWSNNHGVNMAMNWPAFVEYTEEFRDIARGIKSKEALPTAPITLIHQRPVSDDLPEYPPPSTKSTINNRTSTNLNSKTTNNTNNKTTSNNDSPKSENIPNSPTRSSTITNGTSKGESNPFEEEEWDEGDNDNILVDNGEPGVPVKALYDYDGAESDELTFKQGKKNINKDTIGDCGNPFDDDDDADNTKTDVKNKPLEKIQNDDVKEDLVKPIAVILVDNIYNNKITDVTKIIDTKEISQVEVDSVISTPDIICSSNFDDSQKIIKQENVYNVSSPNDELINPLTSEPLHILSNDMPISTPPPINDNMSVLSFEFL